MLTRRIFLKNGNMAMLSLGFAPAFFERAAQAAQTEARQRLRARGRPGWKEGVVAAVLLCAVALWVSWRTFWLESLRF